MKWKRNRSKAKRWNKNHLVQKYGSICAVCGGVFKTRKEMTIDHIIPLSKGGIDVIGNMQLAHFECNQIKTDMTPEEFAEYQS